jgi:hypothetical protein
MALSLIYIFDLSNSTAFPWSPHLDTLHCSQIRSDPQQL